MGGKSLRAESRLSWEIRGPREVREKVKATREGNRASGFVGGGVSVCGCCPSVMTIRAPCTLQRPRSGVQVILSLYLDFGFYSMCNGKAQGDVKLDKAKINLLKKHCEYL